ncbi:MAG: heavy metal translocating P-type ATPase, partial [Rummeliibacillus sp.]
MDKDEVKVKRELILEGLDCANCAQKIENGVKQIDGISDCSVNFATKSLLMETEDKQVDAVVAEAKKKVKTLEPNIKIVEKNHTIAGERSLYLNGLDCANCAAKIETEVGKLEGITHSSVDFVTKKLQIKVSNTEQMEDLEKKATEIIKKIEPDVIVVSEIHNSGDEQHDQDEHANSTTKKMVTRLSIGAILTAIGILVPLSNIGELSLFIIGYLIIGGDIVLRAVKNIYRGQVFDEHFLMTVATIGAFAVGQYPEGVAVMLFYQIGELFQGIAVNRSRKSISALMNIRPDSANIKRGKLIQKVSPEEVKVGDIIIVKPGEKVPLDGKIIEGHSMVDTSTLTGESVPREVEVGNEILSGFINKNGLLTVEVTKDFGESTVSKILELVQNASSRKAPTENFITKFARYYTPVVVIVATILAIIPPLLITGATFSDWIYRALIFLVISCPCALVVSIPLGFFGGIGAASKKGVLVKGSNYLEALNDVKYVVMDKTGTLTKGVFAVNSILPTSTWTKDELLEFAAIAEVYSNHPIAQSILDAYGKNVDKQLLKDYKEIP